MRTSRPITPPLYNEAFEHDGCGTGFVATIDGERSHRIVEMAVRAVVNLTHRGAVSADAFSGDGAGVTIQIPHELLAEDAACLGMDPSQLSDLALAMVFLPKDDEARSQARDRSTSTFLQTMMGTARRLGSAQSLPGRSLCGLVHFSHGRFLVTPDNSLEAVLRDQ